MLQVTVPGVSRKAGINYLPGIIDWSGTQKRVSIITLVRAYSVTISGQLSWLCTSIPSNC